MFIINLTLYGKQVSAHYELATNVPSADRENSCYSMREVPIRSWRLLQQSPTNYILSTSSCYLQFTTVEGPLLQNQATNNESLPFRYFLGRFFIFIHKIIRNIVSQIKSL